MDMATAEELTLPAWQSAMGDDDRKGEAFSWEEKLLALLEQARERLDREHAEAPALCAELLASPPDAQGERVALDPRFRTWGVGEELLRRSAREDEAGAAIRLAGLALAALAGLEERHGEPLVRDLEARAWACLGTARLRARDLGGAEEALREGAFCLVDGTGDLLVDARLLEFEAAVREAQGGLRAASSLLRQAEARYREIGETTLAARAGETRERLLRALNPVS
jgi:hypothetical protein